jgi:hypothetical protein
MEALEVMAAKLGECGFAAPPARPLGRDEHAQASPNVALGV